MNTIKPVSAEERKRWKLQNIADLLRDADLPFRDKLQMIEGMVEVARAFHHGKLPPSPDEHPELQW
jgi:hypothetical protein